MEIYKDLKSPKNQLRSFQKNEAENWIRLKIENENDFLDEQHSENENKISLSDLITPPIPAFIGLYSSSNSQAPSVKSE